MTPTVEYMDFSVEGIIPHDLNTVLLNGSLRKLNFLQIIFTDEPYPLNLSRYFWLMSQQSQRCFEANVLAYGKN